MPARLLCLWNFPGKNTGVDCHFLLQEIFPSQGLNPGLPHCRQMLYHLSHQGSFSLDTPGNQWNTAFQKVEVSIRGKGREGGGNLKRIRRLLRKSPSIQWLVGQTLVMGTSGMIMALEWGIRVVYEESPFYLKIPGT